MMNRINAQATTIVKMYMITSERSYSSILY